MKKELARIQKAEDKLRNPKKRPFANKILIDLFCAYDMPLDEQVQDLLGPVKNITMPSLSMNASYIGLKDNFENSALNSVTSTVKEQDRMPAWNE